MQSTGVANIQHVAGGLVPALRYKDVRAAATWLCNAFGFEEHRIIEDADGSVRYAQLSCGASMIMLCPVGGSAFDAYMVQPSEAENRETQACYVFVPDALAHKSRALEAGAELVLDIDGGEGKGQGYSCRDPEGHVWSFGTYNPWRNVEAANDHRAVEPTRFGLAMVAVVSAIITALCTLGAIQWMRSDNAFQASFAQIEQELEKPVDLASADRLLRQARADLARERALRMQAESAKNEASNRERSVRLAHRYTRENMRAERESASDAANEPVPFPSAKANIPTPAKVEGTSLPVRVASTGVASDEIIALRRAVAQAEAALKQEREQRTVGTSSMRGELERERASREAAERVARDARARVARIEMLRRAEWEQRNGFGPYRDISREVFLIPR